SIRRGFHRHRLRRQAAGATLGATGRRASKNNVWTPVSVAWRGILCVVVEGGPTHDQYGRDLGLAARPRLELGGAAQGSVDGLLSPRRSRPPRGSGGAYRPSEKSQRPSPPLIPSRIRLALFSCGRQRQRSSSPGSSLGGNSASRSKSPRR